MRTVAVSGTRNTFHPRLSKKVASWACPVVLPPQGPPVSTSLWILRVGGIGSFTSKSFILMLLLLKILAVFFCQFGDFFYCLQRFLSVFNYTWRDD